MEESDGLVFVRGLWVPAEEYNLLSGDRYVNLSPITGTIDLDVGKVAEAIGWCTSHARALDVGAHVGSTAVLLAQRFQSVTAFEAIPKVAAALRRNCAKFPGVEVCNCAISNAPGELYFEYIPNHGQLSHALLGQQELSSKKAVRIGPIKSKTIDSLAYADVSFIKIDVEGLELEVVEGARETILRCRPVLLVEQGGNESKHFKRERDEASRFLEVLGMARVPVSFTKDAVYRFA